MDADLRLKQDILDELEWEPSIDAANIGVIVENGIVTLTGHVGSYAEKLTAERVVAKLKGVRGIAEEIEVRVPGGARQADDQIAERVLRSLDWQSGVPSGKIKVKVQKGWVTLDGEVEWRYQRESAARAVENLAGVAGVINNITIKPAAPTSPDLERRIRDALRRNAELEASHVHVKSHDGEVVIDGTVKAWHERKLIEDAVWSAPGVRRVEDRVIVGY